MSVAEENLQERMHRIENLPVTFAGITVLDPLPEKAPLIPCSESDGYRMRPMRRVTLSSDNPIGAPTVCSRSCTV